MGFMVMNFCDIICKYYTMKKLCAVLAIFVIGFMLCGFAPKEQPKENKYFTIHYGSQSIVVCDKLLKPTWHNMESHRDFTKGRTIYERAENAQSIARDFPEIYQIIKKIEHEIERKAFDGNIYFDPNRKPKFWVDGARNGIKMDLQAATREILAALKNKKHADIIVKTKDIPHKTAESILSKVGLRAQYSTRFDSQNTGRSENIARSAACFDGFILLPGEELSFNRIVGPRTSARGYEEAKIIVDGEFVPGVGGGVCQTSTTLFNAALLSGLSVVESHNHSLPISYVPLGRDAMVSSAVDLRLKNNTSAPVYFEAGIEGKDRVNIKVYGNKLGHTTYKPVTEVSSKPQEVEVVGAVPATLEGFQKVIVASGYPARSAKTYLELYNGETQVSRKLIRKSNYKGKTEEIRYEKIPEPPVEDTYTDSRNTAGPTPIGVTY